MEGLTHLRCSIRSFGRIAVATAALLALAGAAIAHDHGEKPVKPRVAATTTGPAAPKPSPARAAPAKAAAGGAAHAGHAQRAGHASQADHADHSGHAGHADNAAHAGHGQVAAAAPLPAAARAQLRELAAAIARYQDIEVAKREGWKRFGGDEPLMGEHWYPGDGRDYRGSDVRLDFSRPNNLMYTDIGGRKVLTGVAYVVRLREGEALPEGFAGNADRWHVHDFMQALQAATEERPLLRWLANGWIDANYLDKGDDRGRMAMVHAWVTLPNPDGVFADYNRLLAYRKLGLPDANADGAGLDAARGLNLATGSGCRDAVDGKLWIADAPRAAARRIREACEMQAARVRDAVASHRAHPSMLNAEAEKAWRDFDAVWARELTGVQRARIAAMSEHGHHGH